jgi:hypothetical protein
MTARMVVAIVWLLSNSGGMEAAADGSLVTQGGVGL